MTYENYFPVLIFFLVAVSFGVFSLLIGRVLAPHRPDDRKLDAYECGMPAFGTARFRFDVRFYLVAILFILFDLEAAFLFPWAASAGSLGVPAFVCVMVFIAELALGLWYIWKKGALNWE